MASTRTPMMSMARTEGGREGDQSVPTEAPPMAYNGRSNGGGGECGCNGADGDASTLAVMAEALELAADDASAAAPTLVPMSESAGGITVWQKGKQVTGLWSINQDRNAWVYLAGIGWKRLSNKSASGLVAMNILGAHARDRARPADARLEADGHVHEIYVF